MQTKYFKSSTINKKGRRCVLKRRNGCSKLIVNGKCKITPFFKKDKITHDKGQHR